MSGPVSLDNSALQAFWTERHLCTLTTLRKDGSPHVVAVGATLSSGVCRVISSSTSAHVRHVLSSPRVAVCQVDGPRWSTVEGLAVIRDDAASVLSAVELYAARYRRPRPNPLRVVIEISVTKVLGSSAFTG